jgi:formylglycine-generating enzyme required for sulfatase activity
MRLLCLAALSLLMTACGPADRARLAVPELTRLPPGELRHVPPGEVLQNGYPATPVPRLARFPHGLSIMTRQVSQAEYASCVAAGACKPLDAEQRRASASDRPAVGISWADAGAYAAWLSAGTGQRFRLPTYAEWAYAAGEAFRETAVEPFPDRDDPAQRWLAEYAQQASGQANGEVRAFGAYGVNARGVKDMAGSVWDWTSDCHVRRELTAALDDPQETAGEGNCGIRVAAGRHIAYLPDFIRNPKNGACSVGVPPANLGLRLVMETG